MFFTVVVVGNTSSTVVVNKELTYHLYFIMVGVYDSNACIYSHAWVIRHGL